MDVWFPPRLRRGSHIRVVAPARSRSLVLEHDHSVIAEARLRGLGLTVSYGDHVDERGWFAAAVMDSAPIELRASSWFTDDLWFLDQDERRQHPTQGWWSLQARALAAKLSAPAVAGT